MTAQPETLKFSPQWIRELPDTVFNSRRHSSNSPTEGRVSSKSPSLFSNCIQKHSANCVDALSLSHGDRRKDMTSAKVGQPFWLDEIMCTPSGTETDSHEQSSGEVTKPYSHYIHTSDSIYAQKSNTNQVITPASHCIDTNKQSVLWNQKSPMISSEPCWQLRLDSAFEVTANKVPDTIRISSGGHSLPSSSTRSIEAPHIGTSLFSGNSSVVSNATLNITSNLPNDGISVPQSDSYSHNNANPYSNDGKRAVSAYYGTKDPDKVLDPSVNSSSVWMQQHIWSKSVPQHLHGFNPSDPTSNSISTLCGISSTETNRHSSCSVPDVDNIHSVFSQLPPFDRLIQSNSSHPYPLSNNNVQHPPKILEEERGFLIHNESDQSDEHMWLYEDPQGRTQGTFSDAQMNEWLMAGIYFTPNLRIRRKCDDTFSTLVKVLLEAGCKCFDYYLVFSYRFQLITKREALWLLITSACNIATPAAGISVPPCQVTEESLSTTKCRSLAYGLNNAPVSVSTPITLLNNSINNLRLGGNAEVDFNCVLNNNNIQQQRQPITSTSTFGNLSSLVPLNQSLPSSNFQFPSRPHGNSGNTVDDSTPATGSFLSPGFWSVLNQYLSLHPPTNQTATPMQQLAETAQLAAQLAALVGSHSPDQTPMQPAQALALAQFLMTRGVGLHNANTDSPSNNIGLLNSKKDEPFNNANLDTTNSSTLHTSEISAVSERCQESQTQWPTLGSTLNQNTSLCSEGRFNSVSFSKASTELCGKNCTNIISDNSSTVNPSLHNYRSNHMNKSQLSASKPSTSPQSTTVKSKIQPDSTVCEPSQSISFDRCNRTQHNGRSPKNTDVCSGSSVRSAEQKQAVNNLSRTGSTNQNRVKVSKSNNIRSPTKTAVQDNSSSQASSNVNDRPIETTYTSTASNSETDPDQTAEDELKKLTQWCQSRLSSMPMREKVDIPTVVELLATLDAPYEVERMVQTFLGETARTAQFVKDFLDRRRPFWQLHRRRREQANTVHSSASQNSSNQSTNTVRSTEKKKRTNPNDTTNNTQRQNSTGCNGLNWNKSDSTHLSNIEQDNQVGILSI
ncbi:PERQ amino acid-rich with GYF domain-containing protein 2 [Schistosoma japonicum]|nr:PERQ amino acid-rich with GYF domain-containing protein 2 [Schistosoma japonicum]KAH8853456.1 PERQ amino acid-rich with GYF domain-containing protein 2 [Schistosoma japonicum]KAH8853467.1 PERQ amino acid-rich with GYF domain-containing protein 2 [Schistosoma japonicum]KAH8853468.1 PERQ amino acid-rich with GYF domain-containing protein 2 [Schistosoma japonicum]